MTLPLARLGSLVAGLLLLPISSAQAPLPHPQPSPQNLHGWDVDVFGDYAVVGCPRDDSGGYADSGSVLVYHRSSYGNWRFDTRLEAPDPSGDALLGWAVAIRGNRIVATAPHAEMSRGGARGAAYVWERGGGDWQLRGRLEGWNLAPFEDFGQDVDVHGGRIAIGSIWAWDPSQQATGAVYTFTDGLGQWTPEHKLFAGDRAPLDRFGFALDLNGDRLIAGAPYKPNGGTSWDGAAYVFDLGAGQQVAKLLPAPGVPTTDAQFGWSVVLDGEGAFVGSPFGPRGAFHLYRDHPQFGWQLIEGVRRNEGTQFGRSLTYQASDGLLSVSRPGRVFFYSLCRGHWGETGSVASPGNPSLVHEFGRRLARDRETLVIGSPAEGLAYVVDLDPYRGQPCTQLGETFCLGTGSGPSGACPCGNRAEPGTISGCVNSTGVGASLHALGTPSLSANDLLFWAKDLPPGSLALLATVRDPDVNLPATYLGDGLSCISNGPQFSQGWRVADSTGVAAWENLFNAGGGWVQEVDFGLQVFYRDSGGPCARPTNTTNAVLLRVTW